MTKVFNEYSKYYDLLYKDKSYEQEAEYILNKIKKFAPSTKNILDLGCGTGKHCSFFNKKGLEVCGVDISQQMIDIARKSYTQINFICSDISDFKKDTSYDVITSLFHVMSYQTENEKLISCLQNAKNHLVKNGLLIFDFWHGPGVLTDKPSVRVKRFGDNSTEVIRIAEPFMDCNKNTVYVHYDISIKDTFTQTCNNISETHKMRYFFIPELEFMLNTIGFEIIESVEFLSDKELSFNSWNALCIARKIRG